VGEMQRGHVICQETCQSVLAVIVMIRWYL
jgi:hypothetical protein